MREAAQAIARPPRLERLSRAITLPAPVRGWVLNENIVAASADGAQVIENWLPTTQGARVRRGAHRHATVPAAVTSMFSYRGPTPKLFAATAAGVYDVTAPADAEVSPTAAFTATAGYWSAQQITTAGGSFLVAVNGADALRRFDGSTWLAYTTEITGIATTALSHVWLHKSRLWFVEKGTTKAHYLAAGAVAGAVATLDLGAVFRRGGVLLSGETWSTADAGDGMDDHCVFFSSEGEAAVYQGSDPSEAASWSLVGVYYIGKLMGRRPFMRAGGDLVVATDEGFVPLSIAVTKDPAALSMAAVSKAIAPYWSDATKANTSGQWEVVKHVGSGFAAVVHPTSSSRGGGVLAVNTETGAWAHWSWAATCGAEHGSVAFFGDSNGAICEMDRGGTDNGEPYNAAICMNPSHLGRIGTYKHVHMARATFVASSRFSARISLGREYKPDFGVYPSVGNDTASEMWGSGIWGVTAWGGASLSTVQTDWVSVNRNAQVVSAQVQISVASNVAPDVEIASLDILFSEGGAVV